MKYLIFTIIFIISLLIFFSCKETDTPQERKITFWNFWSEPYQAQALDSIIAEFEAEHNCTVEVTRLSWNDGKTKLFAAFNSKTAPDVLELGSDWVAQFSSSGVLAEMPPDSMNIDNFVEFSKEPSFWQTKLYAVPWIVDTRVLFYNKELMEKAYIPPKAPVTIKEMLEAAKKINNPGKEIYGWGANGSDRHRLYKKIMYFFWTIGNPIFDEKGNVQLHTPGNINALNKYTELSRFGIIDSQRQLDALFARGKIAFWISGGWLLEKIKNENPSLDYNVALMPNYNKLKGVQPGISFAGGEYLAVSRQSENKALAKEFIKYLVNGKNSIKFCKKVIEAGFPADKNYYNDPYYQSQPRRSIFSEQLTKAKMTPVIPQWLEVEAVIENAVEEALLGKESADAALKKADEKISRIMKNK